MINITNRVLGAYLLYMDRDGDPESIQEGYDELRRLYGLKPRPLEPRRFLKVQNVMCGDSMAATIQVIKRVASADQGASDTPI